MQLEQVCDDRIFNKNYMISLSINKQLKQLIIEHTNWMDASTPLKIRCLAIYNKYTEQTFPRCTVCNKPVTYNKSYMDKFSSYCGPACSRSDKKRLNQQTYDRLSDCQWLYQQRIECKKSFEEIASMLDCSVSPVKKACKTLQIPHVRHNESQPLVMSKLRDEHLLRSLHCKQRNTVEQIAETIGSSAATVSRWLKFHQIETNDSNSYERKINRSSKEQQEVVDFIKTLIGSNITLNNRSILGNKELDILLPDHKIAIEYNGVFYHAFQPEQSTESLRKGRNYHLNKTIECEAQGIRLIHIFSDDWTYRKDIWKSILTTILNGPVSVSYARKLTIVIPSKTDKKIFLNDNHLQGNDKSQLYYGLYDGDKMVCLMTFCKSRYNKRYKWELSRFCVCKYHRCVGGFSRLLKHFQRNHQGSIISYADYSRSQGDVYSKNGFEMVKRNKPSYSYINPSSSGKRMHRSNFTKAKLKIDGQLTEAEYMYNQGYRQVFDCGTLVFAKT